MNRKRSDTRRRAPSPEDIRFARGQRATSNESAMALWQLLRSRRCRGQKFRREHPIPPYTADFCCSALKLVIEVDGSPHLTNSGRAHDRLRDQYLMERGYLTLRISGFAVLTDLGSVMRLIEDAIDQRAAASAPSPPAPLPRTSSGGEGSQPGREVEEP